MPMKKPPHPGISVRINGLEPRGLSVSEGARVLGVSQTTLSRLVNGRTGISPEMAIRLSKAFGGSAGAWIRLQAAYDLAQENAQADEIDTGRCALLDDEAAGRLENSVRRLRERWRS